MNQSGKKMNNKDKDKIKEYLASYKIQLKFAPKYKIVYNPELVRLQKQIYDMNPVYYQLMGKIDLLEKLIKDFE